ncbi:MAG: hypothetical protein AABX82_07680 [Nanoarchaeota archaeon]
MKKQEIMYFVKSFCERKYASFLFLFLLSFGFMFFFTECVPFFFDDHEFHRDYIATSYKQLGGQLFSLNHGGISDGPRPVYGLFFKTLFPILGYDYCYWRIVKAGIFSLFIILFYVLSMNILKKKNVALLSTLFVMTLFPTFLQQFGYNGPHIFAELFKVSAILLFLYDIEREKTSWMLQIAVFFCSLFAVRVYPPGYSIAAILPLFTLFYARKKIMRYLPLFFFIVLIQFPITFQLGALSPDATGTYSLKSINMVWFLTNDFLQNISNPIPNMSFLYYKSATAILTFFGFWLLVVCLLIFIFDFVTKKIETDHVAEKEKNNDNQGRKRGIILASVWLLCEVPYYFFLPEHAVRYSFALFVPFSIATAFFIEEALGRINVECRKWVSVFFVFVIFGAILTNVSYTYAFRAGWGSSFIVFEEVMDHMAEQHEKTGKKIGVLYYAGSAADEYKFVNKSSTNYAFGEGVVYIKSLELNDFSEEGIAFYAAQYDQFFVLKRTTSVSKDAHPNIDFAKYGSMKEWISFEGSSDTFFDNMNGFIMRSVGVSYEPNKVVTYLYEEKE